MGSREIRLDPERGEKQARLCNGIIAFEKDLMGRGPEEVRAYLFDDIVVLCLKSVLTRAEMKMLEHGEIEREAALIREFRLKLFLKNRGRLEELIEGVTGRCVRSVHTDLDTHTGERVIICVLR